MNTTTQAEYPEGSINNPKGCHPEYALRQVMRVAETILRDNTATDNERALADCIIALKRSTFNYNY